jgi:hypothetical protein
LCSFLDAQECFRDREVLFLGSSVSRHWFFALQTILSHKTQNLGELFVDIITTNPNQKFDDKYRQIEKRICGGGVEEWKNYKGHVTACSFRTPNTNTLVMFYWTTPFMSNKGVGIAINEFTSEISASGKTMSRSAVLINGGLELSINMVNKSSNPTYEVNKDLPAIIKMLNPVSDGGGNVCWRLSTRLCCQHYSGDPNPGGGSYYSDGPCFNKGGKSDMHETEALLHEGNSAISHILHSEYPHVDILDAWALTNHSKCHLYEDWVHAPTLAYEQIEAWMLDVLKCKCSGGGREKPPENA